MAPCGGNVVTPKMIRKGQIQIGDKIQFEEVATPTPVAPAFQASAKASPAPSEVPVSAESTAIPASADKAVEAQTRMTPGMIPNTQSMPGVQMQSMQGMQGMQGTQGTFTDDNGVTRRQTQAPQMQQQPESPLNFSGMTDYVNSLAASGSQSPSFNVPSHPMVPPEYEQTIDYDSIQYMNGFLRTQIGRYVRVEQLIGSGNTEERFGFLVGVGNNYLLLQDISNGNILVVDFYSVKFVYIYFGEPVFPNIPLGPAV